MAFLSVYETIFMVFVQALIGFQLDESSCCCLRNAEHQI